MGNGSNGALHKIIYLIIALLLILLVRGYWLFMIFSFRWYVAKIKVLREPLFSSSTLYEDGGDVV